MLFRSLSLSLSHDTASYHTNNKRRPISCNNPKPRTWTPPSTTHSRRAPPTRRRGNFTRPPLRRFKTRPTNRATNNNNNNNTSTAQVVPLSNPHPQHPRHHILPYTGPLALCRSFSLSKAPESIDSTRRYSYLPSSAPSNHSHPMPNAQCPTPFPLPNNE